MRMEELVLGGHAEDKGSQDKNQHLCLPREAWLTFMLC